MSGNKRRSVRQIASAMLAAFAFLLASTAASAQVTSVDPDAAIDGDLSQGQSAGSQPYLDFEPVPPAERAQGTDSTSTVDNWNAGDMGATDAPAMSAAPVDSSATYRKDDLIGAAQGVFGQGAEGLASIIEDLLGKQGEPNAYIIGREGGGAIAFGLRYGSGTMHHKVEGQRPVYWTGPSLGLDLGLNAGNAFVLVYNLHDTQELYQRFGAGEGQAYLVGGFHVSYLRRGDVVLIPVRMGAGLRLGANVGYMKFSEKQRWLPF